MANLTEAQIWESGIYRIETTDPILGGENGTSNVQGKQLANRTAYLKKRADEVDAAKTGYATLKDRLDNIDEQAQALGIDMQDMSGATIKFALDMATQANKGVDSLKRVIQQSGQVTIQNRGVITGCALTKNTSVARNLDISGGKAFAKGQVYRVYTKTGAASVPVNETASTATVKAYLMENGDGHSMVLGVTSIGGNIPDNAIHIYNVTIPANHVIADITAVTLTSVRRIESSYPVILDSEPNTYVALPKNLKDGNYQVDIEVLSASGGAMSSKDITVFSRASNGFNLQLVATADNIVVNWTIKHLNH